MSTSRSAGSLRFAVRERQRYRELQALEDAVNYRLARLAVPCPRCEPGAVGGWCDEHACDVALIAGYLHAAEVTMAELARMTEGRKEDGRPLSSDGRDGQGA